MMLFNPENPVILSIYRQGFSPPHGSAAKKPWK